MKVILLEKVVNLGNIGEEVSVAPGFGRNYLVPKAKAIFATSANRTAFASRIAELEVEAKKKLVTAIERAAKLKDLTVTITARVSDENKLYGSVGVAEIVAALQETGVTVEKKEVQLPEGAIHVIGEHPVTMHLHADVAETITVIVIASD